MKTFIYNLLLKTFRFNRNRIWKYIWNSYIQKNKYEIIQTKLHTFKVNAHCGFPYPLITRWHAEFNNPLLQLAYSVYMSKKSAINIIDVGAGIGDTYFFLKANLPQNSINQFWAIEGDPFFSSLLKENTKAIKEVNVVNVLLSDVEEEIPELVHTHAGTASAIGSNLVKTKTLDKELITNEIKYDLIKIDIDGFDGKALKGAKKILHKDSPVVIFEWHPILLQKTNNDIYLAFETLSECCYHQFILYNKYGVFSHFISQKDEQLEKLAHICLNNTFHDDWHYDVIAIPQNSNISEIELAECIFAKNKKYPF
ncbi:MAG: FkbM family methyltransferase [Cytophagales bacterium]